MQEAQDADDVVERLLAERGTQLMRTAVLLAGSRPDGEDLLQAALERLIRQGRRITGDPEGYLRRTLYNLAADGWRRQQTWRRKLPVLGASTPTSAPDLTAAVDLRDALIRALHQLSPQQRAAVVLRYWEQLSEAEAAEVLGCSPGTVKAAASRGLRRMRELTGQLDRPGRERFRANGEQEMNQEFDEEVKESMKWFTEGVEVPAGLAAQARDQVRRQRRTRMSWIASGTAVAAAAAVVIGAVGTGGPGGCGVAPRGGQGRDDPSGDAQRDASRRPAVVVRRVERALAKAATGNPVAFTRESSTGARLAVLIPHSGPVEFSPNLVAESWTRGGLTRTDYVTPAGRVLFSEQNDVSSGKTVDTSVSYPHRVWWRGTYNAPAATKSGSACTLGETELTRAQWTREIKKLLSCGAAFAGYEQVDGVKAVKLKLSSTIKNACAASNSPGKCTPVPVGWSGVVWANASSLPAGPPHGPRRQVQLPYRLRLADPERRQPGQAAPVNPGRLPPRLTRPATRPGRCQCRSGRDEPRLDEPRPVPSAESEVKTAWVNGSSAIQFGRAETGTVAVIVGPHLPFVGPHLPFVSGTYHSFPCHITVIQGRITRVMQGKSSERMVKSPAMDGKCGSRRAGVRPAASRTSLAGLTIGLRRCERRPDG